jgi:ABC-2 type transport system ATP-binding protein
VLSKDEVGMMKDEGGPHGAATVPETQIAEAKRMGIMSEAVGFKNQGLQGTEATPDALVCRGLGRAFGRKWAVQDLSFSVPRGAVCGFLGLNGAGKTTALRMAYGLLAPTEGSVLVAGMDPARVPLALRRKVGYVIDSPNFYEWLTVRETLAFVGHHRAPEWDDAYAQRLLDLFGVPADQTIRTLSKGQRAKVSLILGLGFHPELLLLDEPTLGLDPVARRQFVEGVLGEFAGDGRTVIISSHQITEIAGLVDHVVIVHEGRLVTSEPAEYLLARVVRLRLGFGDQAPPPRPDSAVWRGSGLVHWSVSGHEVEAVLTQYQEKELNDLTTAIAAQRVQVEALGLEEAFVHLVGGWQGSDARASTGGER